MKQNNATIIVGPVRMSYAHIYSPRRNELAERDEFSCVCLIPKESHQFLGDPEEQLTMLRETIENAGSELKGSWKSPLKDGDKELNGQGQPRHPGYWYFNAKTGADYPPMVIDDRRVPIGKDSGWTSGDWAKVKVRVASYDAKVNKGVTIYLQAVQFLHKDEPFGSDPLAGFAPADDFDPFA